MYVNKFFKLLGNENRVKILKVIGQGEIPVMEIVEELGIDQPLVSHHLRKMKDAGILKSKLNGKQRLYRISEPEILDIVEETVTLTENKMKDSLGFVGEEKLKQKIDKEKPKTKEELLKAIDELEKEFFLLFGSSMTSKMIDHMEKIVEVEFCECENKEIILKTCLD